MKSRPQFDSPEYKQALETLFTAEKAGCKSVSAGRLCLLMALIEAGRRGESVNDLLVTAFQNKGLLSKEFKGIADLDNVEIQIRKDFDAAAEEAAKLQNGANGRSLIRKLKVDLERLYLDYETRLVEGTAYTAFAIPEKGDREKGSPYLLSLQQRTVKSKSVTAATTSAVILLHDLLDEPMLEAFQRLLTLCLGEGAVDFRHCHTVRAAASADTPLLVLVTMSFLSNRQVVFGMGRLSTQSHRLRIALVAQDVKEEDDIADFEGFEIRRIIAPNEVKATLLEACRRPGAVLALNCDDAIETFIANCKNHLTCSLREDFRGLLQLPRKVLARFSREPLANQFLAESLDELSNGRFKLYASEKIYEHDTQAIRQLRRGESYLATHPTYANPNAAHSATYRSYISEQCAASKRGVRVSRIYIDNGTGALEVDSIRDEMTRLQENGVEVRVASIDRLNKQYHDDFVLIGTRMLGLGWPPRGPMQYSYYEIANQHAISGYLQYFESLEKDSTVYKASPSRFETAAYHEVTPVRIGRRPSKRLMVVLRTNGCSYDQNKRGCKMCDFKSHAVDLEVHRIDTNDLSHQLAHVLENQMNDAIEQIDLLTLGNFLHVVEVPEPFQLWSLNKISEIQSIRRVVVESRCNYVTVENLRKLRNALRPDQTLELGVGVESSNPFIRNNVLNKNLDWSTLRSTMIKARQADVGFLAYLLIKPQTLTEREAIEDAVNSAKDVVDLAADCGAHLRIAFEPVFVTQHTDLEQQFIHFKNYELLNLWSVIEVLKRTETEVLSRNAARDITVFVGLSDENLSDNRKPRSCDLCTERLSQAIQDYNATNDINGFRDLPSCCYTKWAQQVGKVVEVAIEPHPRPD